MDPEADRCILDALCHPAQANAADARRTPFDDDAPSARAALSTNTERAMRSDLAIYRDWCRERALSAVPASPQTIAAFVDAMATRRSWGRQTRSAPNRGCFHLQSRDSTALASDSTSRSPRCATGSHREPSDVERMAERLAIRLEILNRRSESVEHPFGSIKHWIAQRVFLMRRLENVRGVFNLTADSGPSRSPIPIQADH